MYFINAEFLYGSEEESKALLEKIDALLEEEHLDLPKKVFDEVLAQYNSNEIYKSTVDELVKTIENKVSVSEIDYIAGGERRDWFYSNMVAYLLKKPHITIFKDLSAVVSNSDFTETEHVTDIEGKNVFHVSDLITEAVSYVNAWIPAIKNINGNMKWTATIVNRMQGGDERLKEYGVETYPLAKVDKNLFKTALENGSITEDQYNIIDKYIDNPDETMKEFLLSHPEFVKESLKGTGKTLKRATKCVEDDIYNINLKELIK